MARGRLFAALLKVLTLTTALTMLAPSVSAKPKFKVLARVSGGLYWGLTFDSKRNLYGTTIGGGAYSDGSVFQLTRSPDGKWSQNVLHDFNCATDGCAPNGSLIFDAKGRLYGAASEWGAGYGGGTIFELTSSGTGGWDFSVLYSFCAVYGCPDGAGPNGVVLDNGGSLYGTAASGGLYDMGTVFELTAGSAGWTQSVLHSFGSQSDGSDPLDALAFDKAGNLLGTTFRGGAYGYGTVFRLKNATANSWKEWILYSFCPGGFPCNDGMHPYAGVVFDGSGNIYGTTTQGGHNICGETHCGTVFKLTPNQNGHWKETVLYEFPDPANGSFPTGGVVRDKAGNLYGATVAGGIGPCTGGCGVAYKLEPRAHGKWKYNVLHKFTQGDGWQPLGGLIFNGKGNLYGTAYSTVFEITP